MSLRVCVLASGSSGNATLVEAGDTAVLIDAGLSAREMERRLDAAGTRLDRIAGICLTHEHSDHTAGLSVIQRRWGTPLYANQATIEAYEKHPTEWSLKWRVFSTGSPFQVGPLTLDPFSVPHDAYDPVGFVVRAGGASVGIVTDMGVATTLIRERIRPCSVLVLEANHDVRRLEEADRPWSLKQRVRGRQGHLSNDQAAQLLVEVAGAHLKAVFLAHMSRDCNDPKLALQTVSAQLEAAGRQHVAVLPTWPDRISDPWTVE